MHAGGVVPQQERLAGLVGAVDEVKRAASRSSSMVSMRLRVSGPVSVMVWRPTRPKRSSSVGSSTSVGLVSSTPRGMNSRCMIGLSLG
jgi:hypothetical protein